LGQYLEHADNTSRLLDIKLQMLLPEDGEPEASVEAVQWMAVLRSCSAYEAYRRHQLAPLDAWSVSEFLVFRDLFPRSIRFSVSQAAAALDAIGGSGTTAARQAQRVMGRLRSSLEFGSVDDLQADPSGASAADLHGHDNQRLDTVLAPASQPGFVTADEALVDLDRPGQRLTLWVDHRPTQLVQHRPRRLVPLDAELTL